MDDFVRFGLSWIQSKFGLEFDAEADLFASGVMDSLTFNEFLAEAEKRFDFTFNFDEIEDWTSLTNLKGLASIYSASM